MKRKIALLICIAMLLSIGLCGCKEKEKRILEISNSYPAPNYEEQLYRSEDVIYGEVIEELESYYSNPDGAIKELSNAWITPYVIQIEKSYKGLLEEGATVVLATQNRIGIRPEDEEKYEIITDEIPFHLHVGQRGIFMLVNSEYLKTDDGQPIYLAVLQHEGVFEEKETGTASMDEEAKTVYASPSFEITLDQIPADIQKADQHYKQGNEVSAQTEDK